MRQPTIWFWLIAGLFLIWNLVGGYFYLSEVTKTDAQYAAIYGEPMAAVRHLYPSWAIAAFAIAVWGGLLASVLLLWRKTLCVPLFGLACVASLICFIPNFVSTPLRDAGGPNFWVMPALVVVIGLAQIYYSRRARATRVLR